MKVNRAMKYGTVAKTPPELEAEVQPVSSPSHSPEDNRDNTRIWTQVLACVGAAVSQVSVGTVTGWTGVTLQSIQDDLAPTTSQVAWIVSVMALGAMVGGAAGGKLMDAVGRRRTLLLAVPFLITSWTLLALAPNVATIITGRAVGGLATGLILTSSQVFISEVCECNLRGKMSSLPTIFFATGILTAYTSGALLSWHCSCIVCGATCLPMLAILLLVPETPYWLLLKGRRSASEASLRWLRGSQCDLQHLLRNIENKLEFVGTKVSLHELWHPRTRTPLMMALFMQVAHQLNGANLLFYYTASIYHAMGYTQSSLAMVYTGLVQLVASGISFLLVDRMGRRPLMVTSTAIVGIVIMGMGFYQFARTTGGPNWKWMPLLSVLLAVSGYCLGCRSIPLILSSELFNTTSRSTAQAVCTLANRILSMAQMQMFPHMMAGAGLSTVFFVHGGVSLVCCLVTFIWIPETKNKSLEEIQEFFESRAAAKNSFSLG